MRERRWARRARVEEQVPPGVAGQFRVMLHRAITEGVAPAIGSLGPRTTAAIKVIADEHPEATPEQIAAAHEAFGRERE